jgi:hypothetical protein
MGILGGIKLGPGRCGPVAVCIGLVLVVFLVLLFVRRPYCNLLDSYFNILVTIIQVGGALYTATGLLSADPGKANYCVDQSELMATIGLYLLISKMILDGTLKVKELVKKTKTLTHSVQLPVPNADLTQRLLDTIQHENEVEIVFQLERNSEGRLEDELRQTEADLLIPEEDPEAVEEFPQPENTPEPTIPGTTFDQDPMVVQPSEPNISSREDHSWNYEWDPSEVTLLELPAPQYFGRDSDDDGTDILRRFFRVSVEDAAIELPHSAEVLRNACSESVL